MKIYHIKRNAVMVILLAMPFTAQAQTCKTIEWAELKEMPKQALAQKYCEYLKAPEGTVNSLLSAAKTGARLPSPRVTEALVMRILDQCMQETERMARVLEVIPECDRPRELSVAPRDVFRGDWRDHPSLRESSPK